MTETALTGLAAVPIGQLRPSPNNPRVNLTEIDELATSIRENGLIQPLVVQRLPGHSTLQIVAGHRRFAACNKLGMVKVPCIIRRDMLPDEELLAMLVENGQRAGLDPIEEAKALQRLQHAGLSDGEISKRVGRGLAWVRNRLMLLSLPAHEQEQLRAGNYTLGHATNLVRADRAQRRTTDRPVGRPKGAKTKPYFGDSHPLADAARTLCSHRGTPKVGAVACGPCWEAVIRADSTPMSISAREASMAPVRPMTRNSEEAS